MAALSPRVRRHLETDLPHSPRLPPEVLTPEVLMPERHLATMAQLDFRMRFAGTSAQTHSDARGAPATDREIRDMYRSPYKSPRSFASPPTVDSGAAYSLRPVAEQGEQTPRADDGATWGQRLRLAEQALASPRSHAEQQALVDERTRQIPYPAHILRTTQQVSFKAYPQEEGTAARYLGVEGINFHRRVNDFTDFAEGLARQRALDRQSMGKAPQGSGQCKA